MASTLTIELNDRASDGLETLQGALDETGKASLRAAADIAEFTESEERQIRVIHEHRGSILQFASTTTTALGSATVAWLKFRESTLWLQAASAPLRSFSQATKLAGDNLGSLARTGLSATRYLPRFGTNLSGMVPVLTGASLALSAHSALLGATGIKYEQLTGATEEQRIAWSKLRAEADALHLSIERLAKQKGIELESLGVSRTSNRDRVHQAAGELGSSITRPLGDLAAGARTAWRELSLLKPVWDEIDAATTRGAQNMVDNLGLLRQLAEAAGDKLMWSGYTEAAKAQERLGKSLEASVDDFQRLRGVHGRLAQEQQDAEHARGIAAIQTLADLDARVRKEQQLAGELAAANRFTEDDATRVYQTLGALERRRSQIVSAETERRKKLEAEHRAWQRQARQDDLDQQQRVSDELLDIERQRYLKARKLAEDHARQMQALTHTSQQQMFENAIAALEDEGASAADVHHARLRQIDMETRQRIEAAETDEDRQKAFFEGQRRRLQEEGNFHRAEMRRQADERKKKTDDELKAELDKQRKLQDLLQQAGGPNGADVLQQQDPAAVRDALKKQRADQAEHAYRQANQGRNMADAQAERRFESRVRAARRQAEIDAHRDFSRGKVNPEEMARAQMQAGNQQLQALQQSGQLSADVIQVLRQQMQSAAKEQAALARLQQEVQAIKQQSDQQFKASTALWAQNGGLKR